MRASGTPLTATGAATEPIYRKGGRSDSAQPGGVLLEPTCHGSTEGQGNHENTKNERKVTTGGRRGRHGADRRCNASHGERRVGGLRPGRCLPDRIVRQCQ